MTCIITTLRFNCVLCMVVLWYCVNTYVSQLFKKNFLIVFKAGKN